MNEAKFSVVGIRAVDEAPKIAEKKWYKEIPLASCIVLAIILLGCFFCEFIMTKDPTYLDLVNYSRKPCKEFLFGTDTLGRDIFSMIWYGGRISITIGILSTVISTFIAIVFGSISGLAPEWLDTLLMRATEILLSIPNLLLVILIQAILAMQMFSAYLWSSASRAGPVLQRSCEQRCGRYATANMLLRQDAWAQAFSTFFGST